MKALDLFCGGGGAAIGLHQAGFDTIVGIDIEVHKNYPFDFIQADALNPPLDIMDFDFVWASPPCQLFTTASTRRGNKPKTFPNLIPEAQELIKDHPFTVIENVPRAPIRADVVLTGLSVGLPYIARKRHFETSFFMMYPPPVNYLGKAKWESGKALCITTSFTMHRHYNPRKALGLSGKPSLEEVKEVMGIPQHYEMSQRELGESIPPAYSQYIATEAIRQMKLEGK